MYANNHSTELYLIKTSERDISQSPQSPQIPQSYFYFFFSPLMVFRKSFFQNSTHTRLFLGSAGVFPQHSGKTWNIDVHAGSSWHFCDPDDKCDTCVFKLTYNRNLKTKVMVSRIIFVLPPTYLHHKRTVGSWLNISFLKLIFDHQHIK